MEGIVGHSLLKTPGNAPELCKNVRNAPFLVFAELKIEPDRPLVCCTRHPGQSGQRRAKMVSETIIKARKPIPFPGIDAGRYLKAMRPIVKA